MAVMMAERESVDLRGMPLEELEKWIEDRQRELNALSTFFRHGRVSRHNRAFPLLLEALEQAEAQFSEAQAIWRERLPASERFDEPVIFRRPGRRRNGDDDGYSE